MKAYYARPITHYNTESDKKALCFLRGLGLEIEDPNQEKYQVAYKEKGMEVFLEAIDTCNLLVFRSLWNGKVTAGVLKEVSHAYHNNIPVMEYRPTISNTREMSVEETRKAIKIGMK